MELTWNDFLDLASVIKNLFDSIHDFEDPEIVIVDKHRRVDQAAREYQVFFQDLKYLEFMKKVRLSFRIQNERMNHVIRILVKDFKLKKISRCS